MTDKTERHVDTQKASGTLLRRAFIALACTVGLGMATVPAAADTNTKLTKASLTYGTIRYFRGKSENVQLGSYGQKKTPVAQPAYLAVQSKVKGEYLTKSNVKIAPPITVDWAKESKTDVEADVRYLKVGGGKATFTHQAAKNAKLKLVKFYLDEGPLKKLLNNEADGARKFLADEGADARIVSEVWVVMEAELADQVSNAGTVSGNGSANGFDVEVKAGTQTTTTTKLTISPDTTFAYLLHRVKKWNDSSKSKIEDLEDDMAGLN